MANRFYNQLKKVLKRNLISVTEEKLTYIQIFGFILMVLGLLYFTSFLLPEGVIDFIPALKLDNQPTAEGVSLAFFTIMLGMVFGFPEMLRGQTKEISTMRIIVFMFANVICMLLLKYGWAKQSLSEIGLDGFWMGIIAFIFGAKATQSYFENAKSLISPSPSIPGSNSNITLSKIAIAQIAKVQNEEKLHDRFPSIEFVSDTVKNGESCLTLYLKDNNTGGIPSFVTAALNETTTIQVQTETVTDMGNGKPHYAQLTNDIANSNTPEFTGSICCLVRSESNDVKAVISSGHVFTNGEFDDFDGLVGSDHAYPVISNGDTIGELYFQQMIPTQDIALVKLNDTTTIQSKLKTFPAGFYEVSQGDLNAAVENVTILSKNNYQRDAFIIDHNIRFRIYYSGTGENGILMRNLILIGTSTDKNKSKTVSTEGDSGSCVYHKTSGKMIGILTGGNDKFSFVLPFEQTLIKNNFKLV
jgi:hypothetical protein